MCFYAGCMNANRRVYPQSALRLTAPSAEGAFWGFRVCGREAVDGARLAAFRSPPPPLRPPLIVLCCHKRRQVAAALSAAVTTLPKTRNRAHAAWAHKSVGKDKPIPSRSSGEGVWGRGASLREAASPPESPSPYHLLFPVNPPRRPRVRVRVTSRLTVAMAVFFMRPRMESLRRARSARSSRSSSAR